MKPLDKALRNQLEKTVKEAREAAEKAAKNKLEQLGVGEPNPFPHLTEEERELRRKLRVHGRQLGDSLNDEKVQTMERLIEEVAYEHWHRMLFARFLAENNLLMDPDPANPVPVTLEECKDLAAKKGAKNGWELAARYAARMLPQIFRPNSPIFQVSLSPEDQQKLEQLIDGLAIDIFIASDSLGWVYQFWQAKRKDEVNASEMKIGPNDLPAVTQLFTEPYMVNFLLDNSIGAWWANCKLTKNELMTSHNEEELRAKAALPNVPLEYLRFVRNEDGLWSPAMCNNGWPKNLNELKILDPCCGSGHFLVAALLILVPVRMKLEELSAKDAIDAILKNNLYGLEIDQRCVELAVFALALTAWRYPNAGGYRRLPELNVACSGLGISANRDEWLALAKGDARLSIALESLYVQFVNAPMLGSLISPAASLGKGSLLEVKWQEIGPLLSKVLVTEDNYERTEIGVIAEGLLKSAEILNLHFDLVLTNVPYLVFRKQGEVLRSFGHYQYGDSENDLATIFLSRIIKLLKNGGTLAVVSPQSWLYQKRYQQFRKRLLDSRAIRLVARLGAGAFDTISGEVVKVSLSILEKQQETRKSSEIVCLDVSKAHNASEKSERLKSVEINEIEGNLCLAIPGYRIILGANEGSELLSDYATILHGQNAGDSVLFNRFFWEVPRFGKIWETYQVAPSETSEYSGRSQIVMWEQENGVMAHLAGSVKHLNHKAQQWRSGKPNWGKKGIVVSLVGRIAGSLYSGDIYGESCGVMIPIAEDDLGPIWEFVYSGAFEAKLRDVDPSLAVTVKTILDVPFERAFWIDKYRKNYPNGLPDPYSKDPTQWVFHGNPSDSDDPLQVAVARMVGYQWPAEIDSTIEVSDKTCSWMKKISTTLSFTKGDGIVCIPSIRGEPKADDRLENLLAAAFSSEWSPTKKAALLIKAEYPGKSLESWLRDKFFAQHCKLFNDRPFIWHIWDGLNDGFAALVNYHRLDYKLLETLIYNYLGDWISQQKLEKARGVDGAEGKLAAAEGLKKRLELILEGEKPFDIFVRWKPIEQQPFGWNPDLNDGIRVNIRPFMTDPDGKKGTGVLRYKPNINWGKDRGRDIESAPWFKLGPLYGGHDGDRINDHHLSLAEKRTAREKK